MNPFRYGSRGLDGIIGFDRLPANTRHEQVVLTAQDQGESRTEVYSRGGETSVICLAHPRVRLTRHYAIPYLLEAGYAVAIQEGRWPENDVFCIHEMLLADIAASLRFLREDRGFAQVILMGNSGGGSLYCFYQSQAATEPPNRLTDTAAGDPYDLNRFDMPPADAIIFLAAHPGEGAILAEFIDPSVTDESDPLSCDPALDMYDERNGFREPPTASRYSEEFRIRYREAQRARIARLDAIARGHIQRQRLCQHLLQAGQVDNNLSSNDRTDLARGSWVGPLMTIYRTEASLAFCDPTIDPSDRDVGSIIALRPDLFNYMAPGFGRLQTPKAWLSTWSGLSSRAAIADTIPRVSIPTLVINYTADNAILPSHSEMIHAASPATDKSLFQVLGDHFGLVPNGAGHSDAGRAAAMAVVVRWLRERFPAS